MNRDYAVFPNDENGDVLFNMAQDGDDLSRTRDIEFAVIFPDKDGASKFAAGYAQQRLKAVASPYDKVSGFSWQVIVSKNMLPQHRGITDFENELSDEAAKYNGRNDGWGCFQDPQPS